MYYPNPLKDERIEQKNQEYYDYKEQREEKAQRFKEKDEERAR